MSISADERATVLAEVDAAWARYQTLLDTLSPADLERQHTVGHWSGRDVVAHIASYEAYCAGLIPRWEAGHDKRWSYEFDENDAVRWDEWNEKHAVPFRALPLAEVRAYAARAHEELLALARASHAVTRDDLLGMTANHYAVHDDDLRGLATAS